MQGNLRNHTAFLLSSEQFVDAFLCERTYSQHRILHREKNQDRNNNHNYKYENNKSHTHEKRRKESTTTK